MGTDSQKNPFEGKSPQDVAAQFNTSLDKGLSNDAAAKLLAANGPNAISEKKTSPWLKFFAYFWGPIPWMIEIAIVLSAVLGRWPDLIIISLLLLINALLGFIQEHKADNAIEALKKKLALKARVQRDGTWQDIDSSQLVVGDVVQIKLGNILPADIFLSSGSYLSVDQSSLTGESLPVNKKVGDIAYSGTIAKLGTMEGIVTATGMNTFFGQTAQLVDTAKTESHLQKAIVQIGKFLIYLTLCSAALILATLFFRFEYGNASHDTIGDIVIYMLVIVIAGIPVALPAVLSVTMAIGANQMSKLKAIVSKLMAIEELAGMDILCSDKTGTLTQNVITVKQVVPKQGVSEDDVKQVAHFACDPKGTDPIDLAIFKVAKEDQSYQVIELTPFDPSKKFTQAHVKGPNGEFLAIKGAPQVIIDMCHPSDDEKNFIDSQVSQFAQKGMRTLGIAKGDPSSNQFTLCGIIALYDPPREDTVETVSRIKELGIGIKMVTGDHQEIATEIAKSLNIGTHIEPASALETTDIDHADGFSEVFPKHKFEIVQALQKKGHITGMTGDGVNDAPALKQADIGIAVSNATDAARAAGDLVLTQPGLGVICTAIEESRRVFGRMNSYAMYRISETCRLLFFLLLSMIIFNDRPLTPIMIILIALLNDLPIMAIAYDHMPVAKAPTNWQMHKVMTIAIGLAIFGVISTFGLYYWALSYWQMDKTVARTLAFMALLCGGNLTIYLTRNEKWFFSSPLPEWKFFSATILSQAAGTLLAAYGIGTKNFVGIGWRYVGMSWVYIIVWFGILVLIKYGLFALVNLHYNKVNPENK
ncbi:MAG: Calcium-transporting ATPase 1 [Chlamydiia bacterium]|nr:Calcium-transporting ATPase 1 [Chlamydiia bacterium]